MTVFLCPVPGCLAAEPGYNLQKRGIRNHRMAHVRAGDIAEDDEFEPEEVEVACPWSDLPLFMDILKRHSLELTDLTDLTEVGGDTRDETDDDGSPEISEAEDDNVYAKILEDSEDKALSSVKKIAIYHANENKWSTYPRMFLQKAHTDG